MATNQTDGCMVEYGDVLRTLVEDVEALIPPTQGRIVDMYRKLAKCEAAALDNVNARIETMTLELFSVLGQFLANHDMSVADRFAVLNYVDGFRRLQEPT